MFEFQILFKSLPSCKVTLNINSFIILLETYSYPQTCCLIFIVVWLSCIRLPYQVLRCEGQTEILHPNNEVGMTWNIVLHLIFVMKLKLCLTPVSYTRIATRWHLHHHHQSHLLFINMQCIAVFHDFFVFYWRFWASADANIYFIFVSSTKKDTYLLRPIQITYLPVLRQNESFQLLSPSPRCSHKLPWQDEQIKLCVPKFRIVNPAFPV